MKNPVEALKQNPGSVVFASYAEKLANEGNLDKAVEILEQGIQSNPGYAFGHAILANIMLVQNVPKRAAEEYQKALDTDPQMPCIFREYGKYFMGINQPAKALSFLKEALKYENDNPELRDLYEKADADSKAQTDLGLSDETTGAITEMFGNEEELPEIAVDTDEAAGGEEVLSDTDEDVLADSDEVPDGEILDVFDMDGLDDLDMTEDSGSGIDELASEDDGLAETVVAVEGEEQQVPSEASDDVDITSLLKTMRDNQEVDQELGDIDGANGVASKPDAEVIDQEEPSAPEIENPSDESVAIESLMGSIDGDDVDITEPENVATEPEIEAMGHDDVTDEQVAEVATEEEAPDMDALVDEPAMETMDTDEPDITIDETIVDEAEDNTDDILDMGVDDVEPSIETEDVVDEAVLPVDDAFDIVEPADGDVDLDSLIGSFGGDDVDIAEPEIETPVDTEVANEPVAEESFDLSAIVDNEEVLEGPDISIDETIVDEADDNTDDILDIGADVAEDPVLPVDDAINIADPADGDDDLDSLIGSFGGDDVDIAEPEDVIDDTGIDATPVETEPDKDMPGDYAVEGNESSYDDNEIDKLSTKEVTDQFPYDEFKKDVDNLLKNIDDDEDELLIEEQKEETGQEDSISDESGYGSGLPDFEDMGGFGQTGDPDEKAAEDSSLLKIEDAPAYDPSQFDDDLNGEPVMSDEEKTELLDYEKMAENGVGSGDETESDGIWDSPLAALVDDSVPDAPAESEIDIPQEAMFGDLSMEEIDALSDNGTFTELDTQNLQEETNDGIDYSDILADKSEEPAIDLETTLDEAVSFDEEVDELVSEDSGKGLSYGDKMIYDIGEVLPADDVPELSDIDTDDIGQDVGDGQPFSNEELLVEEERDEIPGDTETVNAVEEMIKQAPDFEMPVEEPQNIPGDFDVHEQSLGNLLDNYMETLQVEDTNNSLGNDFPEVVDEEIFDNLQMSNEEASDDNPDLPDNEATATIAEIYVRQGFIERGMDIYRILIKDFPDNEEYGKRLEELESMKEQSAEDI
ncbi:hypothetical protein ACFL47_03395 [Candidatus Latescibacterota bacterium]